MEFVRIGGFEQIKGGYGTILQNETMQIFVLFFLLFFLPLVAHICTLVLEYSHVSIPISFLLQPKYSFHRGSQTIGAPLPVLALRCRPQERCHCFRAAVCRFQNRTSRSVEDWWEHGVYMQKSDITTDFRIRVQRARKLYVRRHDSKSGE